MAFIALARLRFGEGWIEPGEQVPVEPGRAYDAMVQRGEIALVPDGTAGTPEPELSAKDQAAKLKRSELDKQAKEAGVEDPGALPNKEAVAQAIATREELDALTRQDLDRRAELAGVESPARLPNKAAVIDAVLDAQEAGVEA
jgi:hypothetical protein